MKSIEEIDVATSIVLNFACLITTTPTSTREVWQQLSLFPLLRNYID